MTGIVAAPELQLLLGALAGTIVAIVVPNPWTTSRLGRGMEGAGVATLSTALFILGAGQEGTRSLGLGASIAGGVGVIVYLCLVRAIARLVTVRGR